MSFLTTIYQPVTSTANSKIEGLTCDASVSVGDAVIVSAAGTVQRAIATSLASSNVLGICESKTDDTTCDIRVAGKTEAIYTGLDVTKEYFLSDLVAGGLTTIPPTASGHVVVRLGQPVSETEFAVNKGLVILRS